MALGIIFGTIFLFLILFAITEPDVAVTCWQHFFDGEQFSAEEFYKHIQAGIEQRKISGATFDRESFFQTSIVSSRREYLRIQYAEHKFYVCAAPFGTGYFASWWLVEEGQNLLSKVPIVSTLMGLNRKRKSFYQADTETMYRTVVHNVVMDAVEAITSAKGERGLTELERQFTTKR